MTRNEWAKLSYLAFAEWWDTPMTDEREQVWFDVLREHDRDAVYAALLELLRDSPRFPPRLGELIAKLEPQMPTYDEAWALMYPTLQNATVHGERESIRRIAEAAGPVVAGWVASYGAVRLALEEVFNPEYGGAIQKRLGDSYRAQVETAQGRQRALERTQRALAELERRDPPPALPEGSV